MSMFEKLSNEDVALFRKYIDNYGDYSGDVRALPLEDMKYLLRFWESKSPLFHAFGDQFIVKREIKYEKTLEELADEMHSVRYSYDEKIEGFITTFRRKTREIFPRNFDASWDMGSMVDDTDVLARNIYDRGSFTIPGEFTKDGRALTVQSGCKVVKMIGKIAEALGIEDGYEEFRQAHSQVLNQKQIKGTLCLSIHPLDYLTMSDNDCGWSSCMSWMEEPGDYRLGTVEMMNSPYVVVAYVESSSNMRVCDSYWNNKRWRQLFIVTKDLILGNRQYPYDNDLLQGTAIKWLKELCEKSPDYGHYGENPIQLRNNAQNFLEGGDRQVYFNLSTCFMYNDVYDTRLAYVNPEIDSDYSLNFSGPAVCMACGEEIEYESVDSCQVFCRNCGGEWRCACCGGWYHGEPCYDNDGNAYCDWCYHNELDRCAICENPQGSLEPIYFILPTKMDCKGYDDLHWRFSVYVCGDCLNAVDFTEMYGEISQVQEWYFGFRNTVNLKNITDEGLERADLCESDVQFLKALRDAETDDERFCISQKYFL